jgi:lipopolysaccharide transport system permease protein
MFKEFVLLPWCNRYLLMQLTRREITARYKGFFLGMLWALLQPLLLMGIYYFVFGLIFQPRWPQADSDRGVFVLILFLGIVIFDVCSSALLRGPQLILDHRVFVKKVIFPLEIFSWVSLFTTLFYFLLTFVLWVLIAALFGNLKLSGLYYIILLIFCMSGYYLGLTWFFSAAAVFARDITTILQPVNSAILFFTPVFYPLSAVPEKLRFVFRFNPLAFMVESARNALLFAEKPQWNWYGLYAAIGWVMALLGFAFFRGCKRVFADCL